MIEEDVGDFPMRCRRCGALLRRRGELAWQGDEPGPVGRGTGRIQRGSLARLLSSRSTAAEQYPPVIHARRGAAVLSRAEDGRHGVLRPESRREIRRVRARQQAPRRAEVPGGQKTLSTLSWAGLALVALLALGALMLRSQVTWP